MAIPPRFMSELRDRLTLSEIIGKRVKLTRAGREFKGCCPFHHEKTPSFTVNDDKQFYHCFGCGAHGDAIGFVMQQENLSFIDALEQLAVQVGMQVPQQTAEEVAVAAKQKDLHALLEDTTKWFETQLLDPKNKDALNYLHERGISEELLQKFRVGYAPDNGQALWHYLKEKGYEDQQMVDAGVVRHSTRGGNPYSFFRQRIIFPVADRRGRVIAFGGRAMPDHLRPPSRDGKEPPKYINSSDTPLFHKGRMLYGEAHARQAAMDNEPVIIVEGYLDVMACHSAGYRGALAPLGTAMTEEQILIVWKIIVEQSKTPVLCFDGDNAGRRAAARVCERIFPLLKPDHSALFAFLPEGQDPDSLIRSQGKESFQKVINNAMPLIDFVWTHFTAGKDFKTPESKAGLEKKLEEQTHRIADRSVQQYYRQAFKEKLYQNFSAARFKGKGRNYAGKTDTKRGLVNLRSPAYSSENLSYSVLLAVIIHHPEIFDQIEEDLGHLGIANERLDLLRQSILNTLSGSPALDTDKLQDHLKERGFETELRAVLSDSVFTHAGFARKEAEGANVLQGWKGTLEFLSKKTAVKECKEAAQLLANDFSKDNEEKMLALYRAHDVNKAGNE